jgi:hypothetical protein
VLIEFALAGALAEGTTKSLVMRVFGMKAKAILAGTLMALLFIACDRGVGPDQEQGEQSALGQETATNEPDLTLKAATCSEVIDGVLKSLNDSYIFPEIAKRMEKSVRERQQRKEYDGISSAKEFARILTAHLQDVSHDKHLVVLYSHEILPAVSTPSSEEQEKLRRFVLFNNFGFEKVERLRGNIGYLDLRIFVPPEESTERRQRQ